MTYKQFRRNTRQREVILRCLQATTCHPTASTLYDLVRKELPRMSLGTVYRNLELLAEIGLIQKLQFSGEANFDGTPDPHPHIHCEYCGRIDDLPIDCCPTLEFTQTSGYKVTGDRLVLSGICPECKAKESEPNNKESVRSEPTSPLNTQDI